MDIAVAQYVCLCVQIVMVVGDVYGWQDEVDDSMTHFEGIGCEDCMVHAGACETTLAIFPTLSSPTYLMHLPCRRGFPRGSERDQRLD